MGLEPVNPPGWLWLKRTPGTVESQALTQYRLPGRETVPSLEISAREASAAPRGQSPVAVSAEPLHARASGAAEPAAGQRGRGRGQAPTVDPAAPTWLR